MSENKTKAPSGERGEAAKAYADALEMMRRAETQEAFFAAEAAFRAASGWRDADVLAEQCRARGEDCRRDAVYAAAVWQLERKSVSGYYSAIQMFTSISGWRDADARAAECRAGIEQIRQQRARAERAARTRARVLRWIAVTLVPVCLAAALLWTKVVVPRRQFARAKTLATAGAYAQAWQALEGLDLEGCADERARIREALRRDLRVGSAVVFGTYEQDGRAENGGEGILWRVLARDGDNYLLLSEHGLRTSAYQWPGTNISWAECQVRAWLNDAFLNAAFTAGERERILVTPVRADPNPVYAANPGPDTEDRVFLLSMDEVERYFPTAAERQCSATASARGEAAFVSRENGRTWWWLRTPGNVTNFAALVMDSGEIYESGFYVSYEYATLRPAMWVCFGEGEME